MFQQSRNLIKQLGHDKKGNVAIVFAGILVPVMASVGSAVDFSKAFNTRTHLQSAMDAAVVGAAKATNKTSKERVDIAHRLFEHNFVGDKFAPRPIPKIEANGNAVTASAQTVVKTSFLGVVGIKDITISANSNATAVDPKPICLLALSKTEAKAIEVAGTGNLEAVNCSAHANSTHDTALYADGTASAAATMFCTMGGWTGSGFSPKPKSCGKVEDPYKNVKMPWVDDCENKNKRVQKNDGPTTLSAGVYCGGLDIMTHANVTLNPGLYVIKNGTLKVGSGATLNVDRDGDGDGDGVTFYMVGASEVDINGGATVDIQAPTSGTYEGFLFIQDKDSEEEDLVSTINGGGSIKMVGTIYLPKQKVKITGNGSFGINSPLMPIIADTFLIRGDGIFQIDMEQANMDIDLPMTNDGSVIMN